MKLIFWFTVIVSGAIAGCATPPTVALLPETPAPVASNIPSVAPTTVVPSRLPVPTNTATSLPAPSLPSVTPSATRTSALASSPATPTPIVATSVASPRAPAAPSAAGTKTYTNAKLGITLDYPSDWSVIELANGARFTSPQGAMIDLSLIDTKNASPEDFLIETQLPNTRCLNSTNPHGIMVRNCLDTVAFSYNANLILKLPSNPARLVSLDMRSKIPNPVFDAIIASARLAP